MRAFQNGQRLSYFTVRKHRLNVEPYKKSVQYLVKKWMMICTCNLINSRLFWKLEHYALVALRCLFLHMSRVKSWKTQFPFFLI